jgi:hypothetical protein
MIGTENFKKKKKTILYSSSSQRIKKFSGLHWSAIKDRNRDGIHLFPISFEDILSCHEFLKTSEEVVSESVDVKCQKKRRTTEVRGGPRTRQRRGR